MPDSFDYTTGTNSENVRLLQALIDDAPEYTEETNSRNANILKSIINNTEYTDAPQSEIEELLLRLKAKIGGEIEVDELNVTENGTYDAGVNKAYNPVKVELPLDSKTITENGTYTASDDNLAGYDEVTVAVEGYAKKSIQNAPTAIATFNASALPMPSLTVGIEATQDLHGYDSPWPAGGGKNKIPITCDTQTKQGVTYTVYKNEDGAVTKIHAQGTATADHSFSVVEGYSASNPFMIKAGSYWFKGISNGVSGQFDFNLRKQGESSDLVQTTDKKSLELSEDTYYQSCYLYVYRGTTINTDIYPMIWLKSSPNDDFAPYSNECPIIGWTEANVSVSGVNVWDEEWVVGTISSVNGEYSASGDRVCSKNYIRVEPNKTYYKQNFAWQFYYDKNKSFVNAVSLADGAFTAPNNAYYMKFYTASTYGQTYNNDISINYPSTDTEYHAYNGQTYTIDLDGTRYGCTLDVVSGVLTVDRVEVDLGELNWTYDNGFFRTLDLISTIKRPVNNYAIVNAISSMYKAESWNAISGTDNGKFAVSAGANDPLIVCNTDYTDATAFKTAMNGVQLVYELATPQTIQLTPTAVKSLLGTNNIWADTGDIQSGEYMEAL